MYSKIVFFELVIFGIILIEDEDVFLFWLLCDCDFFICYYVL